MITSGFRRVRCQMPASLLARRSARLGGPGCLGRVVWGKARSVLCRRAASSRWCGAGGGRRCASATQKAACLRLSSLSPRNEFAWPTHVVANGQRLSRSSSGNGHPLHRADVPRAASRPSRRRLCRTLVNDLSVVRCECLLSGDLIHELSDRNGSIAADAFAGYRRSSSSPIGASLTT